MRLIGRATEALLWLLAVIGGLGILALMLHVVADVLMRNLNNRPIPATFEIVTHYYMIALAFIPLAWVERRGGMVSVELLDGFLPPALLRASDVFVALFSTLVYGALAYVAWRAAMQNWQIGTFIIALQVRVPTWPAFFLLPAGFGLAALVTLLRAVEKTAGFRTEQPA